MSLLANSNAIESGGYNIDRSLRFRSSASANLSRTLTSTTNRQKSTISMWFKRGSLGSQQALFVADQDSNNQFFLYFVSTDNLQIYDYQSAYNLNLGTTQVFRDPSAWYHLVLSIDTTQATAANRAILYINGSQVTAFSTATYPSQNYNTMLDYTSATNRIGNSVTSATRPFDGYLAEVNFIDGQALTPSSFGETSTETGVWVPKKYTGTYGTNGFYLNFSDNTSATTLAYDKSGNGNNWTANNISTTAGATYDSMTDVPTLTSATAANYCVLNPLSVTIPIMSNGNLTTTGNGSNDVTAVATLGVTSGKWYFESVVNAQNSNSPIVGVSNVSFTTTRLGDNSTGWAMYVDNSANSGKPKYNGTLGSSLTTYTTNDICMVAFDVDSGKIWWGKNGTWLGSGDPSTGANPVYSSLSGTIYPATYTYSGGVSANFGQRPFSYTPPTGYVALNTFNLPDPTIKKPNQYMDATLYTGTGSALSVVNVGAFQPSLVWAKARSTTTNNNLYDAVRGTGKILVSNNTDAEVDVGSLGLSAFNSNGFSLGTGSTLNDSGQTYVGWQWKESATAGFDIVTYTGNGSNRTISHNLGVAPKLIIVKSRSISSPNYGWQVQHASLGATKSMVLNSTSAALTSTGFWNDTAPTSSVFTLGNDWDVNKNAETYVAYLFAEIPGFSKFGSYTGNGSTDGPFVYCGFRPKYVLVKRSDSAGPSWWILDSVRSTYNVVNAELAADQSAAETSGDTPFDFVSNGFKCRSTWGGTNANGGTYIYAAFAENPFKYSNAR